MGVYSGYTNHYNIGAFMEKGLTMAAGQVSFVFSDFAKVSCHSLQPERMKTCKNKAKAR